MNCFLKIILFISIASNCLGSVAPTRVSVVNIEFDGSYRIFATIHGNPIVKVKKLMLFVKKPKSTIVIPDSLLRELSLTSLYKASIEPSDWEDDELFLSIPIRDVNQIDDRTKDDEVVFMFKKSKYKSGWIEVQTSKGTSKLHHFTSDIPKIKTMRIEPAEQVAAPDR
ncbi:hypothetical protein HW115_18880 [Verrucomicrobiaceae bacterium N1E253]|uniref:Lipoprotein n=2 Tax=Oceaniferula marina TaxID=2748318 RepID=A0A851GSD3_9BACT|nr:hypothetical protein [Oceaniferula marina]